LPAFAGHDEAEVAGNFGERIERLIATATAEADAIRADAVAAVKHLRENAGLEAERIIASGKRQAAETITAGQQRAEADVKSAGESRRQAEELLANAHSEAEQLRRKAREEANQIRLEVDEHARQLLARTHDETNRDLSAARAELAELEHRKADMEGQLASLRTLLSEAVAPKLPAGIHDLFGPPAPPSADISAPLYTRRSIFTPEQPVSNPAVAENPAFENQPLEVQQELDEYHGA
jgi:F0F1-type ATP synthase membrane subunit b/b'